MAQLPFSTLAFNDVDQFRENSLQLGWELESTQLSRGPNFIRLDCLALPELLVAHHQVKQAMYDVFDVPAGHVVFAICRAKLPAVWCGVSLPPTLLAILRPVRTYWARLPAGWETYEFTIAETLIERTQLFPPRFFTNTGHLERAILPLVEPQTNRFLSQMDVHFQTMKSARDMATDASSLTELYDSILWGLQQVIDAGMAAGPNGSLRPTRRADLVEKARDLMIGNLGFNLTADEIAQSLDVSYRVLNYAFRDALGISPHQYFVTEKLHAARRQLKSSDISVTEACTFYGFASPSRFTHQYKRLFGELPSVTRKR